MTLIGNSYLSRRQVLFLVCAASGVAACSGSLFQSKAVPSSIYLLSANLEGARVDSGHPTVILPADLAVLVPRVRSGLDSDRISALYSDRRLDHFAAARWSGPLDLVMQDLVVQAFKTGGNLRAVSAEASAFPSGYWLEIQVADFQAEYGVSDTAPSVHVHLLARLGAAGDRRVLGTFDADCRQPAAENRLTAIVDAYEHAANAALAVIVADTAQVLAASLENP